MLKKILAVVVLLIVGVMIVAATRPDVYRVERRATIRATPDAVFAWIGDFHRWTEWSPWEKLDPAMQRTFTGAASGKGSVYGWKGNSDVGSGSMEITESTPPTKLAILLTFLEPWESQANVEFALAPEGDGTQVTWSMSGKHNFISRVFCVFVNMDSMIGKDYETGLANLKALAEK